MTVLITGAGGFIGKNLVARLSTTGEVNILCHGRQSTSDEFQRAIANADCVCHLAGVNRPDDVAEFVRINTDLTRTLCATVKATKRPVPIIFASSVHAKRDSPYGLSKLAAERELREYSLETGNPSYIFRLPNVFGKWCLPNYNSVVATYCYNIGRDLPIRIDDPAALLQLAYIDDVVDVFLRTIAGKMDDSYCQVDPVYQITVGDLADQIRSFRTSRGSLISEPVGVGLVRALYATYISYLPPEAFAYDLPVHSDTRGVFVEMLKTRDSGQFSFFTVRPRVTRGGHYHHSKTEKFLVVSGRAKFRFRHIVSEEVHEIVTSGEIPRVVEVAPGWTHDVTNVGNDDLVVMLWANEVFDRERPDTFSCPI